MLQTLSLTSLLQCRGFAAGIFGDQSKFEIVDLPIHERFTALADESIDLYFGAAPTIGRDLREVRKIRKKLWSICFKIDAHFVVPGPLLGI